MEKDDHIITAYRDHGHALAVGMSMNECMAEMYGKHTGCSKGKGGSMHFFAPDKNYWGGTVSLQDRLHSVGLAFALKYKGLKGLRGGFSWRRCSEPRLLHGDTQPRLRSEHPGCFRN